IGGGTFTVPFLSRYQLSMQQVVGTAAACGMPIAIVGALTNMLAGLNLADRPPWSLGYVYLPALLGVALASVVFARIGASMAHRVSSSALKRVFALCLIVVGVRFLMVS
ncbi:MAG: sulfite exporter TauE/SafE family protein, partial [Oleiphilaceae bacterium]|nr:sulfite exporter TauE/SafE family protein [Oleiphilaceae bacterium]